MNQTPCQPEVTPDATLLQPVNRAAKLMIVDDDPVTVDLVCKQLRSVGYRHFIDSMDPAQVLETVAREKPDVILLDIIMPKVSGLELLRQLRGHEETAHLPVIILTAADDCETKVTALELGATDFVSKPVNFVELAPRVRNALIVKEHHDQLKRYAAELEQQVQKQTARLRESYAELERANTALRHSCQAAEAATRAKSEFLAKMSHEIRTPLTSIMGFAEELLADPQVRALDSGGMDMLRTIWRNGNHLLQIVNDILDVAKVEKGQLRIGRVPCSPAAVLAEVVQLMQPLADAKGLTLTVESVGPVPKTILSDSMRLQQILTNLIGNAIKFTSQGSVRIVMRLFAQDLNPPQLRFDVIDTGIGIPPDRTAEIFKPFVQGDAGNVVPSAGAGLGLTICRYLVGEMGGQIQVDSQPGKGSTFSATIATGPLPADESAYGKDRDDTEREDRELAKTIHRTPAISMHDCRVLLAEDSPDNQRLISLVLEKAGAQVTVAGDGELAFDLAEEARGRQEPFDVILTDIQMPGLDGYQLAQRLRQAQYDGRIIALTANAMAGERDKCLSAGCDDYLSKPINRDELLSMVARHARKPASLDYPSSV